MPNDKNNPKTSEQEILTSQAKLFIALLERRQKLYDKQLLPVVSKALDLNLEQSVKTMCALQEKSDTSHPTNEPLNEPVKAESMRAFLQIFMPLVLLDVRYINSPLYNQICDDIDNKASAKITMQDLKKITKLLRTDQYQLADRYFFIKGILERNPRLLINKNSTLRLMIMAFFNKISNGLQIDKGQIDSLQSLLTNVRPELHGWAIDKLAPLLNEDNPENAFLTAAEKSALKKLIQNSESLNQEEKNILQSLASKLPEYKSQFNLSEQTERSLLSLPLLYIFNHSLTEAQIRQLEEFSQKKNLFDEDQITLLELLVNHSNLSIGQIDALLDLLTGYQLSSPQHSDLSSLLSELPSTTEESRKKLEKLLRDRQISDSRPDFTQLFTDSKDDPHNKTLAWVNALYNIFEDQENCLNEERKQEEDVKKLLELIYQNINIEDCENAEDLQNRIKESLQKLYSDVRDKKIEASECQQFILKKIFNEKFFGAQEPTNVASSMLTSAWATCLREFVMFAMGRST